MENLSISTTQNVAIDYQLASIGERLLAGILDYILFFVYFMFTMLITSIAQMGSGFLFIFFLLPVMFYHLVCEVFFSGQSLGKLIMGIKVAKIDGSKPTLGSYVVRWIFRLVDVVLLFGAIATVTIIVNGKGQRFGDIAANTTVVRIKKKVTLNDTMYRNVPQNYEVVYPEAINLLDEDIKVVNEVLHNIRKYRSIPAMKLTNKTRHAIENKLGIQSKSPSEQFLNTIVNDYSFLHSNQNI